MKNLITLLKKSLSGIMLMWALVTIFSLVNAGKSIAQNMTIPMGSQNGANINYCASNYDSIKAIIPSSVTTGTCYWNPGSVHSDTLTLASGFSGSISCYVIILGNPVQIDYVNLSAFTMPTKNLSSIDTVCGIEQIILNAGNVGSTYLWDNNATTQTTIVGAGLHWNVSTNLCGSVADTITVLQYNPNPPNLGLDLTVCQGTIVTLNPGLGYSNVLWNPGGATTPTLSPTVTGNYIVQTTNAVGGCIDMDTINITFLIPPAQDIDLVTIDTANGNNKLIWDGLLHGSATATKIYRELTTNNYQLVGTVTYATGSFTDTVNSRNQAWRYKIAIVDTCGNEGNKSPYVQSIHSWVTPNIPSGFTVQWTPYLIESKDAVSQYNIYYGTQLSSLTYLTFVSGTITVFTLPSFLDSVYVIGAQLSSKGAYDDALSNWVSESDAVGINELQSISFGIFPNPANDKIEIQIFQNEYDIELINIYGQIVFKAKNEKTIHLDEFSKGAYILKISGINFIGQQKIIIY